MQKQVDILISSGLPLKSNPPLSDPSVLSDKKRRSTVEDVSSASGCNCSKVSIQNVFSRCKSKFSFS